ncbi:Ies5p KNAG_0C03630 [Huiozyma naganishii CBS 8797]|uniref:Uncharacterized protein n=1 Tax=Huiozyma naganishii (strain ATCC MYA-139 / BCRC 22969 / CBS 8797 / KCTC 17520 / NBRC 10181 / NCYC 3082 / Yp74L-3) TaxID=1071383 RepID=J7RWU1_HUIN7|nr:hypothetical protein KNAG_0C03630 [Kazachstania naganishii CBS 8797]CCK69467.1 hypothetical protein KNAG_0C03630 [Kazachstania naganishii CBS 8797]
MAPIPTEATEKDFQKMVSRNEELAKQETTLTKEYTTLLRKSSSLFRVLEQVDKDLISTSTQREQPKLISQKVLNLVPELKWYNDQILLASADPDKFSMTQELQDSYDRYKSTSLLYQENQSAE